jgi:hypothetical protein
MRLERGIWSSQDANMALDKVRLMLWFGLTQGKSNLEHVEAGVKAKEEMEMFGVKSSRRRLE